MLEFEIILRGSRGDIRSCAEQVLIDSDFEIVRLKADFPLDSAVSEHRFEPTERLEIAYVGGFPIEPLQDHIRLRLLEKITRCGLENEVDVSIRKKTQ